MIRCIYCYPASIPLLNVIIINAYDIKLNVSFEGSGGNGNSKLMHTHEVTKVYQEVTKSEFNIPL